MISPSQPPLSGKSILVGTQPNEVIERIKRIAREVAAVHANDVDRNARFPTETIEALRKERLLGAFVPRDFGGLGIGVVTLAGMCEALGSACGSSGLIAAYHHVQVACLVRHADTPALQAYLAEIAEKQRLIGVVTSEVGHGGDIRTSVAALERNGESFLLDKEAAGIAYGEHADAFLVTGRRDKSAPPSDQVLTLLKRGQYRLERTGNWDTLGMRGMCSPPFKLEGAGPLDQIFPLPFGDIASRTMVPFTHILWAAVWLGIANDAVTRARAYVRKEARKTPGTTPPVAIRLAEVMNHLQLMRNNVHDAAAECESLMRQADGATDELHAIGFAIRMNSLKLASSQLVAEIVQQCLLITGLEGYRNDSKISMGRHLRDAQSAALMIGNDRIYATNADLLLVHKDD